MYVLTFMALCAFGFNAGAADAPAPVTPATAPAPVAITMEQRIADLEAYVNNGAPTANVTGGALSAVAAPGHNGFIMICAALVLFMTLPGLALFYGGLVRSKNVLSVLAQCLGISGLVTILWFAFGYSLVFGTSFKEASPGIAAFFGGTEFFWFKGITSAPNTNYAYWISQNVFSMYQLMFAIITPALIVGAIAERMKFSAIMLFVALWMFVVYFPLAHMIWGASGYMNGVWNDSAAITAIDFAGGTVVHMSSGWSALVLCLILGKRLGFGKQAMMPHSMTLCMVGTGILWVGWYGFNAGSALAADGVAANAFTTTTIAAAVAGFSWGLAEYLIKGKASVLGFCSGIVGGLVVITPACGFVSPTSSFIIGILAGVIPFIACSYLKKMFGYDDALDTFGVHAVGGTLGAFLTGLMADPAFNANLISEAYAKKNGLFKAVTEGTLWIEQLKAMAITVVLSVVATVIIAYIVKSLIGLRPTEEVERQGLDINEHGEEGYNHNS